MKFALLLFALIGYVAAANAGDSPDLRVTFTKNPAMTDKQCNPIVQYELDSQLPNLSIQSTIEMGSQKHVRNIALLEKDGVLTAQKTVSGFSPEEESCKQLGVKLIGIMCGDPETFMLSACPMSVRIEGEEIFANFESLL